MDANTATLAAICGGSIAAFVLVFAVFAALVRSPGGRPDEPVASADVDPWRGCAYTDAQRRENEAECARIDREHRIRDIEARLRYDPNVTPWGAPILKSITYDIDGYVVDWEVRE